MTPAFPVVVFDLDGTLTAPGTTRPAPGAVALVEALHRDGTALALATSASTRVARRVLDELGVGGSFAHVAGLDGGGDKDAAVAEALLGLGLADAPTGSLLVGDGPVDMHAAITHGLRPVGAGWGGSSADELRAAGATVVLGHPDELWSLRAS
ncbi:hypothetical protein Acsp06_23460 [Actinomycetospora sp. NBRC 106375]|uniref:HAD family hydrolase n=1 Tax=Actinomycetospora sp. NBRC 106375 TaxID=3032207 RepID=UPI0024A3D915|nr:HAD hydrolase-like protein [Actinomycetospora sp. NBRC 106375]GLZ46161.1 hypothetical protein Acsp06_23460 [Actinomycetospora sp. NBRC 106375]